MLVHQRVAIRRPAEPVNLQILLRIKAHFHFALEASSGICHRCCANVKFMANTEATKISQTNKKKLQLGKPSSETELPFFQSWIWAFPTKSLLDVGGHILPVSLTAQWPKVCRAVPGLPGFRTHPTFFLAIVKNEAKFQGCPLGTREIWVSESCNKQIARIYTQPGSD